VNVLKKELRKENSFCWRECVSTYTFLPYFKTYHTNNGY